MKRGRFRVVMVGLYRGLSGEGVRMGRKFKIYSSVELKKMFGLALFIKPGWEWRSFEVTVLFGPVVAQVDMGWFWR